MSQDPGALLSERILARDEVIHYLHPGGGGLCGTEAHRPVSGTPPVTCVRCLGIAQWADRRDKSRAQQEQARGVPLVLLGPSPAVFPWALRPHDRQTTVFLHGTPTPIRPGPPTIDPAAFQEILACAASIALAPQGPTFVLDSITPSKNPKRQAEPPRRYRDSEHPLGIVERVAHTLICSKNRSPVPKDVIFSWPSESDLPADLPPVTPMTTGSRVPAKNKP